MCDLSKGKRVAMNHLQIEGKRVCDYPSTLEEAESALIKTTMPLTHNGRSFEPIGMTLAREMGEGVPDGLPPEFISQLAASVCDLDTASIIGRLCLHCIAVARSECEVSSV